VDWIVVSQDGDQWTAIVNVVMNLRVPQMLGRSSVNAQLLASPTVVRSIQLMMENFLQLALENKNQE
jgi:hypothetical protein